MRLSCRFQPCKYTNSLNTLMLNHVQDILNNYNMVETSHF